MKEGNGQKQDKRTRKERTKGKTKEQNRNENNKSHRKQTYLPTQKRANMPAGPHSGPADCAERLIKKNLT